MSEKGKKPKRVTAARRQHSTNWRVHTAPPTAEELSARPPGLEEYQDSDRKDLPVPLSNGFSPEAMYRLGHKRGLWDGFELGVEHAEDLMEEAFEAGSGLEEGGTETPLDLQTLDMSEPSRAFQKEVRAAYLFNQENKYASYSYLGFKRMSLSEVEKLVSEDADLRFENGVVYNPRMCNDRLRGTMMITVNVAEGGTIGGWPGICTGEGYYRAQLQRVIWEFFGCPQYWRDAKKTPVRLIMSGGSGWSGELVGLVHHRGVLPSDPKNVEGVCVWPEKQLKHIAGFEEALSGFISQFKEGE